MENMPPDLSIYPNHALSADIRSEVLKALRGRTRQSHRFEDSFGSVILYHLPTFISTP